MRSHRFSVIKKGIPIIWPWLFKLYWLRELSILVIYPFVFYSSKNVSLLSSDDLQGNTTLILIKQQEELFQVCLALVIISSIPFGWWAIICFLVGPGIFLGFTLQSYLRKRYPIRQFSTPFAIAFLLTEIPFYTEAYINCNYPQYLSVRKIFAWIKYI